MSNHHAHQNLCKYFCNFKILRSVWLRWIWYQNDHKCVENTLVGVSSADNLDQNNPVAGTGQGWGGASSCIIWKNEALPGKQVQKLCKMGSWLVYVNGGPIYPIGGSIFPIFCPLQNCHFWGKTGPKLCKLGCLLIKWVVQYLCT